ncbi:AraC family transcriptional regulator [Flavobacterium subsaxonicum]|uniref:HTH araC/xylS-type domain-containing protein n=1 Tax=Flavobacterium subsaxonicum WB 4.1-42 = DSM 21790 TaxID=1121898 RepID=A0A0A2MQ55_9FLAO|nr:AraC family transcriptional regulator [Flavobacterium subsaxonicum]KGO93661.1 hypothetical protein Q766_06785 [Flavobacterium subsaxonicum WB 4.1-42 = DSM 21790]
MLKKYILMGSLCSGGSAVAQHKIEEPDTLQNKAYDYLYDCIDNSDPGSKRQAVYLDAFLQKAKRENNEEELVNGYKNYVYYAPVSQQLNYADSMVLTAKTTHDRALQGSAYLTKGIAYYGQKKHKEALDNYLIANGLIANTNDQYLIYKTKYNMAQIKQYLGFYHEAISLLKECTAYFEGHDDRGYLNSLHSLGLCYNKIGNYGLSARTNAEGLSEGKRLGVRDMEPYFIHSEGINHYFLGDYTAAIHNINQALPYIIRKKDFANEAVGNFYLGKCYMALGDLHSALPYFVKVDKSFEDTNFLRPDLRENYEILIRYYQDMKDLEQQLYYVKKLLRADRIIEATFVYLSGRVHKDYDTKELLEQKQRIELLLDRRKYNDYIYGSAILGLFLTIFYLVYRHITNQKIFRKKFEALMQKDALAIASPPVEKVRAEYPDLNPEAAQQLVLLLAKFERDKRFLEVGWTLVKLAAAFNSNTKYLSKVIRHYRDKGFTEYINDLKINYLIDRLKEDKKMLNYTNKALGEEVGYSSTQRFANAFFSVTGMPAVFFIQEMKRKNEEGEEEG